MNDEACLTILIETHLQYLVSLVHWAKETPKEMEDEFYASQTKFYDHLKNVFDGVAFVWQISPLRVWADAMRQVLEGFKHVVSREGFLRVNECIDRLIAVAEEHSISEYEQDVAKKIFREEMFSWSDLVAERAELNSQFWTSMDEVKVNHQNANDDAKRAEMWADVQKAIDSIIKTQPFDWEARTFSSDVQARQLGHAALTLKWSVHAPNLLKARNQHQCFSTVVKELWRDKDPSVQWVLHITGMLLNLFGGGFLIIDMCMFGTTLFSHC